MRHSTLMSQDADAMAALVSGSEAALEDLLGRHWETAYRIAWRITGDPASAEDAAQDAFVELLRCADRFDPARSFRPWFYRIVRNVAAKQARSHGRRTKHETRAARPGVTEPGAELRIAVREALESLTPKYREALSLHFLDGLTQREVAEVLGCPLGTVASRVRRGLESLRATLGPALAAVSLTAILPELAEAAPPAPAADALAAQATPSPDPVPPAPRAEDLLAPAAASGLPFTAALVVVLALFLTGLGAVLVPSDDADLHSTATVSSGGASADERAAQTPPSAPDAGAEALSKDPPLVAAAGHEDTAPSEAMLGRVFLPSGEPAEGATVWIRPWGDPEPTFFRVDSRGAFPFPLQGEFELRVRLPQQSCHCDCEPCQCTEYFTTTIDGDLLDEDPESVLRLFEPEELPSTSAELNLVDLSVRGEVVDEEGRPVAEAQVAWFDSRGQPLERLQVRSDAEGAFVLPMLLGEMIRPSRLFVGATGFVPRRVDLDRDSREVRVTMRLERVLSGQVVDDTGRPVAGASVRASGDVLHHQSGRAEFTTRRNWSCGVTDRDGRFQVRGLPSGEAKTLKVSGHAEGLSAETVKVTLAPAGAMPSITLVLRAGGALRGRVLDEAEHPVANANVAVEEGPRVLTDEAGQFAFEHLRSREPCSLLVTAPGFLPARVDVRPPETRDVILERAATPITGQVLTPERSRRVKVLAYPRGQLDADLSPHLFVVSPTRMYAQRDRLPNLKAAGSAVAGWNGRFSLSSLPAGTYDLLAFLRCELPYDPRGSHRVMRLDSVRAGDDVKLTFPSEVRVRLLGEVRAAETGAHLMRWNRRIYDAQGQLIGTVTYQGTGSFDVPLVDQGALTIAFYAPERLPVLRRVSLTGHEEINLGAVNLPQGGALVQLAFTPNPQLETLVRVDWTDPVTGLPLSNLFRTGKPGQAITTTPGRQTLRVQVSDQDGRPRVREVEVDAKPGRNQVMIDLR